IVWTSVADSGIVLTIRFLCHVRKRRSTSTNVWEEILRTFAEHDNIDFAYPTTRYYNNEIEGKMGTRFRPDSS
ncbi:MAG: mechanosensitive ion channel family protein, partial [Verrucomicrobiota bacterium]